MQRASCRTKALPKCWITRGQRDITIHFVAELEGVEDRELTDEELKGAKCFGKVRSAGNKITPLHFQVAFVTNDLGGDDSITATLFTPRMRTV